MTPEALRDLIARALYESHTAGNISFARDADAVLAALRTGGYEIVRLPEPEIIQGEKRWDDGNVWTGGPGRVRAYLGDARMSSVEARELAASLLAAAAVAEQTETQR